MPLEVAMPLEPMEAELVAEIPTGEQWQYEPKWDGFRCLAFRDGKKINLQSKSGQPLERYFPDIVSMLEALGAKKFVLDGELVIPVGGRLSFNDLLMRIHPAASRVRTLSDAHPAMFVAFDLLCSERGKSLCELPLHERRPRLEKFAARYFGAHERMHLSPATRDLRTAQRWFRKVGGDLDGLIAKRLDMPYQSGNREGMQKVKHRRTCDCVVGGFRYGGKTKVVGSLLLGLYDEEGLLNHVGFTSSFNAAERKQITAQVKPLIKPPGFTGRAPGGPSRWSTKHTSEWQPLATRLVVEVEYDHYTDNRFRHGTRLLRWRPDKLPQQCGLDQVAHREGRSLKLLE